MKRILLAVIAILVIGVSSCKKDESIQPEASSSVKVLDKKDTQQWD